MSIYLDYNASTPVDQRVIDVMVDVYQNKYGNADSRTHDYGETARLAVENARQQVADLLAVKKDEVFFTSGATESDNIVIQGLVEYGEANGKKHIITTAIEHKAVLEPLGLLEKKGFTVDYVKPDISGRVKAEDVISLVRDDTLLVSVMHANNETGIIQPVYEIGEALADKGTFFHIDAAQSFGKLVDESRSVKYDMLSASAHKMYGPQGIGALILRKKRYKLPPVKPIMVGGGQEHGFRPGTVPTALIVGFGEACRIAKEEYKENYVKYQNVKKQMLDLIKKSGLKYSINGNQDNCIANTLNVSFHGVNSEAIMLATKQYCGISNGSACNSTSYAPSYVLMSMGIEEEFISSSVRISFGTTCEFDYLNKLLNTVLSLV